MTENNSEVQGAAKIIYNLELRDLFAMSAFQALLSRSDKRGSAEEYAEIAYRGADAMLEAREKKEDK